MYKAVINGNIINYEDYKSEFVAQTEALEKILTEKYGSATDGAGVPEWHTTEKGYTYLIYGWDIGTKRIEMRAYNKGIYFSLELHIFKPSVVDKLEKRTEQSNSEAAKKAKDIL
ncbi:hypothetical protein [Pedobacter rhodius]|uniref:Cytoplasmic protein n=1 Tax=Pedobacter rhodius TaxID=3004098 RepID=A0ABT4L187_9SPHI|nr:hypothetical protein [Pedobacter sp. SJ11]MCZ4224943.1 hypothetical protein [Pedobacter sp. SJ11]